MWISRQIGTPKQNSAAETGTVTLNSNGKVEAVSTGVQRDINVFSPFGYSFSVPEGEEMLLIEKSGEQAALGIAVKNKKLLSGEIKIESSSGAYIYLKNDGSVIINGLEISRDGVINDK